VNLDEGPRRGEADGVAGGKGVAKRSSRSGPVGGGRERCLWVRASEVRRIGLMMASENLFFDAEVRRWGTRGAPGNVGNVEGSDLPQHAQLNGRARIGHRQPEASFASICKLSGSVCAR
jgi:hypothetical protein